jgi:hypothetical protein
MSTSYSVLSDKFIKRLKNDKQFLSYKGLTDVEIEQLVKDVQNEYNKMSVEEVIKMLFKDENTLSSWSKDSIHRLADLGLIKGDEQGNFNPKNPITREELAVVLDRLLKLLNK